MLIKWSSPKSQGSVADNTSSSDWSKRSAEDNLLQWATRRLLQHLVERIAVVNVAACQTLRRLRGTVIFISAGVAAALCSNWIALEWCFAGDKEVEECRSNNGYSIWMHFLQ